MIAFTGFLACCLLAMLVFPQTEFGRLCHTQLVERPVSALSRFRSHHILYAVICIPVVLSGGEFVALLGPEFFAAYAMELAICIDAVVVSIMARGYATVRAGVARFAAIIYPWLRRSRARKMRRSRCTRSQPPVANDDDDDQPAMMFAA